MFYYFSDEVDAVYVVSPPKQHYQDIKTALEYKKHILCESPITVSKSECTELFSLAKKNGCILSNIRQSVSETVCEVVEDFYGRKEMMLL